MKSNILVFFTQLSFLDTKIYSKNLPIFQNFLRGVFRILLNICNGVSSQKQQMVFIHQLFPQKGFIFYRVLNMFLFLTATLCENGKKLTYLDFCWILYESDCYTYSNKNWENQLFRIHSKGTLHPLHYSCIFLRGVTALRLT